MQRKVAPLFYLTLALAVRASFGQCPTDLKKIYPDRNEAQLPDDLRVASGGKYLVVSSFRNDTTGFANAGAAFLYEYTPGGWINIALLTPSDGHTNLQFGTHAVIDSLGETIAIGASGGELDNSNSIYVYQKPNSGWASMTQTEKLIVDPINYLYHVVLSADGLTVLGSSGGEAYVYKRDEISQLFNSNLPVKLQKFNDPTGFCTGISLNQHFIAVSSIAENAGSTPGTIAIYSNEDTDFSLITKLEFPFDIRAGAASLKLKGNLLVCPVYNSTEDQTALVYTRKEGDSWNETAPIEIPYPHNWLEFEVIDSTTIVCPILSDVVSDTWNDPTELSVVTIGKTGTTWSNPQVDTIYSETWPIDSYLGTNYVSWNGSQLCIATTLNSPGSKYVNSVTSLTKIGSSWTDLQKINISDRSSNLFNFGIAMVKSGNNLIVGSPNDSEVGAQAGAVNIFEKDSNNNWIKSGKILPPLVSLSTLRFGDALSATDKILAVGASRYGKADDNGNYHGQVFIYEKTGATWSNHTLVQIIDAPDDIFFSEALSVSPKVLAIVGVKDLTTVPRNCLSLYERNGSGYAYSTTINLAESFSGFPEIVVQNDSLFLFTGLGGTVNTQVAIYVKNPVTSSWEPISTFDIDYPGFISPAASDYSKVSIEVTENNVFIGIPNLRSGNVQGVGGVYVFSKVPGTRWPTGTIPSSSFIRPQDAVGYDNFGYSLSSINNTLLVGAPGAQSVGTIGSQDILRNTPGAVYAFIFQNYDWDSPQQLIKYQGTASNKPLSDFMGMAVESDIEFYFSGAPYENNDHGAEAGAVYILPIPTFIEPLPSVCLSTVPFLLTVYHPGGSWSGPGIVNGVFNPAAGIGSHLLSYTIPGCTQPIKFPLEVVAPITSLITDPTQIICPESTASIKIQPDNQSTYKWYFKTVDGTSFIELAGETSYELITSEKGFYYAKVTGNGCSGESQITTIQFEPLSVSGDVPNVFTPNGDTFNQTFSVTTTLTKYSFAIFNRWGEKVYQSKNANTWDGNNQTAGIYFWILNYQNCRNEEKVARGWVQLVR